jgi:lysophospholipase L1-like esterase
LGRRGIGAKGYDGHMPIRLALLGDSIAFGQGAARTADTPASRLVAGLFDHGIDAAAEVFAVPGARSTGLPAQVDRALSWDPDAAVVVIGANDLTHRVPPLLAARHLETAVRRLRGGGAEVVVAPAPDLSIVPHVPASMRALVRAGSHLMRDLQVQAVEAAGGWVADRDGRTSTAFAADRLLFSRDSFHPSSAGYAVIAAALLPALLEAVTGPAGEGRSA